MEESDSSTADYLQSNSGLLRFKSAPSSLLENFAKKQRLSSRFCPEEENGMSSPPGVCRNAAMSSQLPPQYPRQSGGEYGYLSMDSMDYSQGKGGSGLMRQNSSPAGLFSHLPSPSGYDMTRGIGSFREADNGINEDTNPFSNRLKNHMNFPSGLSPSLGMLSRITEVENESGVSTGMDEGKIGSSRGENLFYNPGFQFASWNGPPNFTDSFSVSIKRELDNDQQQFGNPQIREPENRSHMLTHHLSLPKTSAEMANMEKLLHLQDSVPCKLRAKRGCATHPRSIAERVRRTRISERMRKLQDLVPNMDKQTNTADMLDLAVDYIKTLQHEYKTLTEIRSSCKCLRSQ